MKSGISPPLRIPPKSPFFNHLAGFAGVNRVRVKGFSTFSGIGFGGGGRFDAAKTVELCDADGERARRPASAPARGRGMAGSPGGGQRSCRRPKSRFSRIRFLSRLRKPSVRNSSLPCDASGGGGFEAENSGARESNPWPEFFFSNHTGTWWILRGWARGTCRRSRRRNSCRRRREPSRAAP